ncbi:hypothetical protein AI2627V1_5266 [Klebsiella pneumoniae]|nr:hypothetical protein AI2836V1_5252 [Klebsiella pneumoniae]CAF2494041.1 hypothetical protein AI2836V1_5286 [Klebsiella pneumoniae]CAH5312879.1 hypothetical protein AI2836V1_5252 [Klebsiella pneumoniae]CAH5316586.1 hypothetical protein AI2836V1_5286 [Klebsiella pneumoniae]CAH5443005.1 hypothetical protein AI2627V1_5266 [Klebsiella pneumoniae]
MKWRYSLRWKLPHRPCPGPRELISVVVEAGQAAPEEVMSRWVAGSGYAVCVDFLGQKQIQRWSDERKAAVRRRNMQARIKEGANKQVISSQADSLIKISRIWADFFPANTSNQPI